MDSSVKVTDVYDMVTRSTTNLIYVYDFEVMITSNSSFSYFRKVNPRHFLTLHQPLGYPFYS
jgi:hypothetical protein